MILAIIICIILGYAFGCISTGYLIGKANHVDIRRYGSGNAGTTNALRTLGWKAGALTLIGDLLKAVIPILIVRHLLFSDMEYEQNQLLFLYTGLGVVLGHNYPFWLHFKGGKGIAATGGAMLAFDIKILPIAAVLFLGSVGITRYVSVGSLLLAVLFPCWVGFTNPGDIHMLIVSLLYTISAFYMHRANIRRLLNGTENKLGQRVKISSEDTSLQDISCKDTDQNNKKGKDGTKTS